MPLLRLFSTPWTCIDYCDAGFQVDGVYMMVLQFRQCFVLLRTNSYLLGLYPCRGTCHARRAPMATVSGLSIDLYTICCEFPRCAEIR